jgi:hypothetical protein
MTIAEVFQLAIECRMPSFGFPCPDIGDFAHTFEPMELDSAGRFIQHQFYFAASVQDCLSKQAARHRWECEQEAMRNG